MNSILMLVLVLVGLWIVVSVFFKMVGFLVNLLLIIAAVLFVVWLFRTLTGRSSTDTTDTTP